MTAPHTGPNDAAVQHAYSNWLRHYYHEQSPPEIRFAKHNPLQEAFFAGYHTAIAATQTGTDDAAPAIDQSHPPRRPEAIRR